jgi:hypothetical protein
MIKAKNTKVKPLLEEKQISNNQKQSSTYNEQLQTVRLPSSPSIAFVRDN